MIYLHLFFDEAQLDMLICLFMQISKFHPKPITVNKSKYFQQLMYQCNILPG